MNKIFSMFFKPKYNHFETVYKNAYKAFFVLCLRYCNTKEDAEEVFNDGMMKYFDYEKKKEIKEETRYALIKKILINCAIDWIRKKKMSFENVDDTIIENMGNSSDVEYNQLKDELLILVQGLPPQTRLIFNLYIFEGWSHKQIAEGLNITENTSYWHLNQGKKKVLTLFNQEPIKDYHHGK